MFPFFAIEFGIIIWSTTTYIFFDVTPPAFITSHLRRDLLTDDFVHMVRERIKYEPDFYFRTFIGTVNKILDVPYFSIQSSLLFIHFPTELEFFKFRHRRINPVASVTNCARTFLPNRSYKVTRFQFFFEWPKHVVVTRRQIGTVGWMFQCSPVNFFQFFLGLCSCGWSSVVSFTSSSSWQ